MCITHAKRVTFQCSKCRAGWVPVTFPSWKDCKGVKVRWLCEVCDKVTTWEPIDARDAETETVVAI